jgi:hypothetical protein
MREHDVRVAIALRGFHFEPLDGLGYTGRGHQIEYFVRAGRIREQAARIDASQPGDEFDIARGEWHSHIGRRACDRANGRFASRHAMQPAGAGLTRLFNRFARPLVAELEQQECGADRRDARGNRAPAVRYGLRPFTASPSPSPGSNGCHAWRSVAGLPLEPSERRIGNDSGDW